MEKRGVYKQWWDLYQPNVGIRDRVTQILESHAVAEAAVVETVLHTIYDTPTEPFATAGAHEFISHLLAKGNAVTIWSQGDPVYQHTKIDHFGLRELYKQLQFVVSTDKCKALESIAATYVDETFVVIDDKVAFLKSGNKTLTKLPHKPTVITIHVGELEENESNEWTPTSHVLQAGHLIESEYDHFFQEPTHVLCDFDRTLFDPDRFTNTVILPLLEKTIETHSH